MISSKDTPMGRFSVTVELANHHDVIRAESGDISPSEIRRTSIRGVVDSGAARLVLPEQVVKELGLDASTEVKVRYAHGRLATRALARGVQLTYLGRSSAFTAVVEPARESALIGAIVMEELDLIVDCTAQQLLPRDPKGMISEVE